MLTFLFALLLVVQVQSGYSKIGDGQCGNAAGAVKYAQFSSNDVSLCTQACDDESNCQGYTWYQSSWCFLHPNDSNEFQASEPAGVSWFGSPNWYNPGNVGAIDRVVGGSTNECWMKDQCTGVGSTTNGKFKKYLEKLQQFLDFDGSVNGKERKWNKERLMSWLAKLAFTGDDTTNQFRTDAKKWFFDAYIDIDGTCQDRTFSEQKWNRLKTDVNTFIGTLSDCVLNGEESED